MCGPRYSSAHVTGLERVTVATGLALALPVFGGLLLYAAGDSIAPYCVGRLPFRLAIVGAVVLMILQRPKQIAVADRTDSGASLPVRHAITFGVAIVIAIGADSTRLRWR